MKFFYIAPHLWGNGQAVVMDHGYAYNKQPGPQAIIDLGQYFRITDYQNLGTIWNQFKTDLIQSSFFCTHKGKV